MAFVFSEINFLQIYKGHNVNLKRPEKLFDGCCLVHAVDKACKVRSGPVGKFGAEGHSIREMP